MKSEIHTSKKMQKIISEIAVTAGYLWQKGWAECSAGNLSVDVTDCAGNAKGKDRPRFRKMNHVIPEIKNNCYLVTLSGSRMRDVAADPGNNLCMIRISEGGDGYSIVWGGENENTLPTSELSSHLAIYRMLRQTSRPQKAIVHTQPAEFIALSHITKYRDEKILNNLLWSLQPETIIINPKGIGIVPYFITGSDELAAATREKLKNHNIVLWEKHGTVAVGDTITEAFDLTDVYVKSAQVYFLCKSAGCEPEGLSIKQLKELVKRFALKADDL